MCILGINIGPRKLVEKAVTAVVDSYLWLEGWRVERLEGWKVEGLGGWKVGGLEGWRVGGLEGWKV